MIHRNLIGLLVWAAATSAGAHDPAFHEMQPPKPKPTTCEQYADRETYSNDLTDPDIKALKDTCDAEEKAKEPQCAEKQDEKKHDD